MLAVGALCGCEEWFWRSRTARLTGGARATSNQPVETISRETIFRRLGGGNFGSYGAGIFEHMHIALRVGPTEVRGVRNFFNGQCMAEIARFGQDSEDPEYN
jgi:hypothetical protein